MKLIQDIKELQAQLGEWRAEGDHVALVPTMGNLHVGHMSLVELAREHAERVVVTVFVNPTQFSEIEDFDDYPRTLERDTRRLKQGGADVLLAPDVDMMYPFGIEQCTVVSVPYLSEILCGSIRPGHFAGVTSVVARFFSIVQPDIAVFGQKDFQQQLIIRRMAADLSLPIKIITAPIVRDDDGLAMSSRNSYLSDDERAVAPKLYETLKTLGEQLQAGERNYDELEKGAYAALAMVGFAPDYVAVRRAEDLSNPDRDCDEIVVLAAATLGVTRLIDNVVVTI